MSIGVPHLHVLVLGAVAFATLYACDPTPPPFQDEPVAAKNVCGGWLPETFLAVPGEACGTCEQGRYVCQGESALVCVGDWQNECGGCEVLDDQVGASCGVCDGAWACSADGEGLTCMGGAANACGGCSVLEDEVGASCGVCGEGKWLCDSETGGLRCDEPPRNACGGCREINGTLGGACGTCDLGTLVCDDTRERLDCVEGEVQLNECGGCLELLADVGSPCGACGVWMCAGLNGVECQESAMLLCGYIDEDGDGWGVSETECSCTGDGIARVDGDCDDTDPEAHPICGNREFDCGDDYACRFTAEAEHATTVRPVSGVDVNPGLRTPLSASVDVSGDGVDDLIVAMPDATCADETRECGAALVLAGPLHETKISLPMLSQLPEGHSFGSCVATGDYDGDGRNDVAIIGETEDDVVAHFFLGPIADMRLLQPGSADYSVDAVRSIAPAELLSCHTIRNPAGGASVALSFDANPYVQLVTVDGIADDVNFHGRQSRVITDVLQTLEGDIVYIVSTGVQSVAVERWQAFTPFGPTTMIDTRTVFTGRYSGVVRGQYMEMDEGIGLLVSSAETGVGIYLPDNPGWPSLPDVTMLGMRVLPDEGWPVTSGMDLDGDGHLEFAVGNPTVSARGELVWGRTDEYFIGWRSTIYPGDATVILGDSRDVGFGLWLDGRGDLNADGERDLVVLEAGGQGSPAKISIFFARQGY